LAVRVPDHAALRDLIRESGVPWASTSANLSGMPALTDGGRAAREFEGLVDYIWDGGASLGRESSVVDASGPVRILREGAISRERIEQASAGL
jgi:L-threonylcarbamoyladenylate synthase